MDPEIHRDVLIHSPINLVKAVSLAKVYEEKYTQTQTQNNSKPPKSPNTNPQQPNRTLFSPNKNETNHKSLLYFLIYIYLCGNWNFIKQVVNFAIYWRCSFSLVAVILFYSVEPPCANSLLSSWRSSTTPGRFRRVVHVHHLSYHRNIDFKGIQNSATRINIGCFKLGSEIGFGGVGLFNNKHNFLLS